MNKQHTIHFMFAALLFCGACSTVQRAPVVDRQETDTAAEAAAEPDDSAPAGAQVEDDDSVTWTALPEPENAMPPAAVDMPAAPAPGRISANPAVIALLDDTDLRLSQGNTEGALSAVERALRLGAQEPLAVASPCAFAVTPGTMATGYCPGGKIEFLVDQTPGDTLGQCRIDKTGKGAGDRQVMENGTSPCLRHAGAGYVSRLHFGGHSRRR